MGGVRNSSKTRVRPVFDALTMVSESWLPKLLSLATLGPPGVSVDPSLRWTPMSGYWEPNEMPLDPPLALLSWLVRHFKVPQGRVLGDSPTDRERAALSNGDPDAIGRALRMLRNNGAPSGWHVLEGPTYPDALVFTPDAVVVVEGKRTEPGPTLDTTWLPGRHQMIRHLDAAWEIRGRRRVYGLLIAESDSGEAPVVPEVWRLASLATWSGEALASSLPHRSPDERLGIRDSFLGVTTWQHVLAAFALPASLLPETV